MLSVQVALWHSLLGHLAFWSIGYKWLRAARH